MDWWEIQAKSNDFKKRFFSRIFKALSKMMLLCNSHALMSKLVQENQRTLLDLCMRESTPLNVFMVEWMTFCKETNIHYFSVVQLHVLMYELDDKAKQPSRMVPNVKDAGFYAMDPLPGLAMTIETGVGKTLPGGRDRYLTDYHLDVRFAGLTL